MDMCKRLGLTSDRSRLPKFRRQAPPFSRTLLAAPERSRRSPPPGPRPA